MPSDKDTLIDMGFSEKRVVKALKVTKGAGLQPAMDWLFAHADDPEESFDDAMDTSGGGGGGASSSADAEADSGEITAEMATAQSLVCDDCGRMFRDATAAEAHAIKTQHANFSESTQAIKPLTEEEKKKKLEELKARLALKREEKRLQEIEEEKSKEKVRRKTGQEMTAIKDKMQEMEMKKALDEKLREKEADRIAKAKIKAQIEQDKKDRAARLEKERLERQGLPVPSAATASAPVPAAAASTTSKTYAEARIQLRMMDGGVLTQTFNSEDALQKVFDFVASQTQKDPSSFKIMQTFPRKALEERSKSLKDLGLCPSASLTVTQ